MILFNNIKNGDVQMTDKSNINTMNMNEIIMDSIRNRSYRVSVGGLNPTGASCRITDEFGRERLVGRCHRAVWYKKNGVPPTREIPDYNMNKMQVGIALEDNDQASLSKKGLLIDGNIKLRHEIGDKIPIMISGEIDSLIRYAVKNGDNKLDISNDIAIGVEQKTGRGYFQEKIIMGKSNKLYPTGYPKLDHIMQTAIYLHMRKPLEEHYGVNIPYFLLGYLLVDCGKRTQFHIELKDEYQGEVIIKDEYGDVINPNAAYFMEMNIDSDKPVKRIEGLTIENIIARYEEMLLKLMSDEPPERDFDLRYTEERIEDDMRLKQISKTQYDKWHRSEKLEIGDWQCSWCDWKELCYPQSVFTEDVESGKLTIKEASIKLN